MIYLTNSGSYYAMQFFVFSRAFVCSIVCMIAGAFPKFGASR